MALEQAEVKQDYLYQQSISYFSSILSNALFTDNRNTPYKAEYGFHHGLELLSQTDKSDGNVYVIGNGGSAAIASHIVNDFCNTSGLRAHTLHEPALMTCFTNDYGYENAYASLLSRVARRQDLLIAISSSGNSINIHRAVDTARQIGLNVITLSGFSEENVLRCMGDLNIWLDASHYGMVEVGHLFLLHHLADRYSRV